MSVLLACAACGEEEHAPLYATSPNGSGGTLPGDGGASQSLAGAPGSETGGSDGSGGSETGGSGSGSSIEKPDHPMYFMGDSEGGGSYSLCDLFSGEFLVMVPLTAVTGFTNPTTGHLVYYDAGLTEVRDAQAQESVDNGCRGFTMSTTGALLCGLEAGCRVDELENVYCPKATAVVDADGLEHPLSAALPSALPTGYAVHTKAGGGFWLLGTTETWLGRWSIDPDGTLTFDGEYAPSPGADLNYGFALDDEGAAYSTANIGSVGGIVRYSADFESAKTVITDPSSGCSVYNFNGAIFSTP